MPALFACFPGSARLLLVALALALSGLQVARANTQTPPSAQAVMDALTQANAAVVGVKVRATEGARSAATLGQRRSGSGVVIGDDGLILTIGYLMLEAQEIEVITQEGKSLPAVAVAYDIATGFGLVRPLLPMRGIAPVKLGSLQDAQPGEPLMAATGAPVEGDSGDVSMTQLVSKRPFSGSWEYHLETALFTSPPVTAGGGNHSGAPLFNQRGELLGIGSLLVMDAKGENQRLPGNMFVPVDLLKPILGEMRASGTTRQSHRPWLGVTSTAQDGRVQIMRVAVGSPAESAGLEAGDVVLAVDDVKVNTLEGFYKKLWAREQADAPVKLTLLKGGDTRELVLKPQDRMLTLAKPAGI
jgi:serine protease Do